MKSLAAPPNLLVPLPQGDGFESVIGTRSLGSVTVPSEISSVQGSVYYLSAISRYPSNLSNIDAFPV